jgi:hypothetical protein
MNHGDHHAHAHGGQTAMEEAAHPEADVHGMLMVGEEAVFLSHLPMFGHDHHDVQAILAVHLSDGAGDPQAAYADDRRRTGEGIYTLEPRHFFLPHIVEPEPGQECLCEITGDIYRGHFERGGIDILPNVTATIDQVVHFRRFDPHAVPLPHLTYLLFGAGDELFLAHLITRPPDFDQVVSVAIGGALPAAELRQGPTLAVPGRANRIGERLQPGERVAAVLEGGAAIAIEVGREFYLEEGELGLAFSQEQTREEKAAGF